MERSRPHVLLIHCHDLGDLIGCYPDNSAQTPHLDRMAEEGALFTQYFACAPQCSPSRAGMYTGLHPNRNGLQGLAHIGPWNLNPALPTLPKVMKEVGYWSAQVGVFHIGSDPKLYDFEASMRLSHCEEVAEAALHILEDRPTDRPFFAVVGFFEPHRPYTATWPHLQDPAKLLVPPYLVDCPAGREELSRFYGEVSRVDAAVGRLLEWLQEQALDDETLVIFTTDHGIAMPLAKGTLYDPGLKIALLMRWPGVIPAGRRVERLLSNVDLFPSILDAVEAEDCTPAGLDGRSFWPCVVGGLCEPRQQVFAEITWHDYYQPMRCIRTATHKLIRNFEPGIGLQVPGDVLASPFTAANREALRSWPRPEYELYDLTTDPLERHNLAGDPAVATIEALLKGRLQARLEWAQDPILRGPVEPPPGYREALAARHGGLPA